jgi:surface polysaccharide O-acyltransferase-like enzyme
LMPYLVLSLIPIAYFIFRIYGSSFNPFSSFIPQSENLFGSTFIPFSRIYLRGFVLGYWYIPFVMIVFAMSPIFICFIKLRLRTQFLMAIFLFVCSILIHRGKFDNNFAVFQNVIFFTPIYMFGILSSENRNFLYSKITGKEFYILITVITLAIIQAYIGKLGSYFKDPFTYEGLDLMVIQKIIFCFLLMIWLNRFENYTIRPLKLIAENSFGIFFTHSLILFLLAKVKGKLDYSFPDNSFMIYCLVFIAIFSLSLLLTLLVRKTVPKYSRYIIGC